MILSWLWQIIFCLILKDSKLALRDFSPPIFPHVVRTHVLVRTNWFQVTLSEIRFVSYVRWLSMKQPRDNVVEN